MLFVRVLPEIFRSGKFKFGIPIFSESGNQRTFQELICAHAESAAESLGRTAYFPAVHVDCGEAVIFLKPDRIEPTGYGFHIGNTAFAESLFKRAQAFPSCRVAGVDTIATVYDLSHQIAVGISI